MRKLPAFVSVAVLAAFVTGQAVFAQSRDCRSSDPDTAIAGCGADILRATPVPTAQGMLPVYYSLRASAYQKKDMFDQAKADLDMAIALQPEFPAYFNRGVFFSDYGMAPEAIADFEAAIAAYEKKRPPEKAQEESYAQAHYRRADLLRRGERAAEAMPSYDKAVALRPDNLEFRFNRALGNSRLERNQDVIADLTIVLDASPRRGPFVISGLNNRGLAYMRLGDYTRAIADLDRALAIDPASPGTLARRGIIFERAGQRDKAIADFRESLKRYAKMQEALDGLQRLGVAP